jgi:hypothetical protein
MPACGRDAVLVAGGFMAVRCDRPVQGAMIESARTRHPKRAFDRRDWQP